MTRDSERGQTTSEYAVILGLLAIGLIGAVLLMRTSIGSAFRTSGEAAAFRPPTVWCDASYDGACIPSLPPDLDCSDVRALGFERVRVVGSDPHGLDADGDGVGCNESG